MAEVVRFPERPDNPAATVAEMSEQLKAIAAGLKWAERQAVLKEMRAALRGLWKLEARLNKLRDR